jgi:predicted SAM-dependent methyltransferase
MSAQKLDRANIGCGMNPTEGWHNFDNSFSVKLAGYPSVAALCKRTRVIGEARYKFLNFLRDSDIRYAQASKRLPFADDQLDVIYSSHMLEHLSRSEAKSFLSEARRTLRSGGIIRLAVPDLRKLVDTYIRDADANEFISSLMMHQEVPENIRESLRERLVNFRGHRWMYDKNSLCSLLSENGFRDSVVLKPGETQIPNPGELDLWERAGESLYVEAYKP